MSNKKIIGIHILKLETENINNSIKKENLVSERI